MNINSRRRKQRITALSLVVTLLLGGCSKNKNDSFKFVENDNNELVAMNDSYIDNDYINKYYVLEVYNNVSEEVELHIVRFDGQVVGLIGHFTDVFTNIEFSVGYLGSLFDGIKITALNGHLVSLNLGQDKYSYEDMKYIYEVIKENYVYEDDNSLEKIRKFDNRI